MSTALYDEALVKKINNWINGSQLKVYGPNELRRMFETMADENNDEPIKLPIINISRDRGFTIRDEGWTRKPLSYDGITLEASYEGDNPENAGEALIMNAIPITLNYQLDVYTKFAGEADILMRNLIFNLVNFPGLTVEIPKAGVEHTATITVDRNVVDNSNIPERFFEKNFTRLSIAFSIEDAYLWDIKKNQVWAIDIHLDDIYESDFDPYFPEGYKPDYSQYDKEGKKLSIENN